MSSGRAVVPIIPIDFVVCLFVLIAYVLKIEIKDHEAVFYFSN